MAARICGWRGIVVWDTGASADVSGDGSVGVLRGLFRVAEVVGNAHGRSTPEADPGHCGVVVGNTVDGGLRPDYAVVVRDGETCCVTKYGHRDQGRSTGAQFTSTES
jgi:hypothetical protein